LAGWVCGLIAILAGMESQGGLSTVNGLTIFVGALFGAVVAGTGKLLAWGFMAFYRRAIAWRSAENEQEPPEDQPPT